MVEDPCGLIWFHCAVHLGKVLDVLIGRLCHALPSIIQLDLDRFEVFRLLVQFHLPILKLNFFRPQVRNALLDSLLVLLHRFDEVACKANLPHSIGIVDIALGQHVRWTAAE